MLTKLLLDVFGSLGAVLAADVCALEFACGHAGVAGHLRAIGDAMVHASRGELQSRPIIGHATALLDYLSLTLAHARVEEVRVLYLDGRNHLITETAQSGSVDEAPIYVREVIKRGLYVGATSILLAHNHPSGDPTPSEADRALTRRLSAAARLLGMHLADHVIVARGAHYSFRANGSV